MKICRKREGTHGVGTQKLIDFMQVNKNALKALDCVLLYTYMLLS